MRYDCLVSSLAQEGAKSTRGWGRVGGDGGWGWGEAPCGLGLGLVLGLGLGLIFLVHLELGFWLGPSTHIDPNNHIFL